MKKTLLKRSILVFYILGLVSLFADMVYEGGRSVSGAYLESLKSPPTGPALIGVGEFIGYVLRFLSGYIATIFQSSGVLWGFTIAGYAITAASIPLLAFATSWHIAVVLYIADRVGKGFRAPSREAIVAEVAEDFGLGKGFGIHELLDQFGAFIGPVIVAFAIVYWGYKQAFLILLLPGLISVFLIILACTMYPSLKSIREIKARRPEKTGLRELGSGFWYYVASSSILALGFMHWAIASYYLKVRGVLSDYEIGLIYSIAMIVDAIVAIPLGLLFDKKGLKVLFIQPAFSLLFTVLVVLAPRELTPLAALPWGIVMCSEESIMKATVAKLTNPSKRPLAYGVFGLLFGIFWAIGGLIYSALLVSTTYTLIYAVVINTLSLYLITLLLHKTHRVQLE